MKSKTVSIETIRIYLMSILRTITVSQSCSNYVIRVLLAVCSHVHCGKRHLAVHIAQYHQLELNR